MKKQRILCIIVTMIMMMCSSASFAAGEEAVGSNDAFLTEDFSTYAEEYEVNDSDNWVRMFNYKYSGASYSYFGNNTTTEDGAVLSFPAVVEDGALKVSAKSITGKTASEEEIQATGAGATLFKTFTPVDVVTGRDAADVNEQKAVFEFDIKHGTATGTSEKWSDFYIAGAVDADNKVAPTVYAGFKIATLYNNSDDSFHWSISPASKMQYQRISEVYGTYNEAGQEITDTTSANQENLVNTWHKVRIELVTKTGGSNTSVYRLYFDGVKIGGDHPTINTLTADTTVGSFAYRHDCLSPIYLDNITAKTVTARDELITDKNINFEDSLTTGLSVTGTGSIETYDEQFGYNKYLKVADESAEPSAAAVLDMQLPTDTSMDYKTVVIADILAKPGSKIALGDAASLVFDPNSEEIGLTTDEYTVVSTYTADTWYRVRMDLHYAKNGQEYKYIDLYIDGKPVLKNASCPYSTLSVVKLSGNTANGISFDNFKVFGVSGKAQIADDTKLLYEIRYANELIDYYVAQNRENRFNGTYGEVDIAASYTSFKAAVDAAETAYYQGADYDALETAHDNIETYLALIGGEIAEYRFKEGIDRSYDGEGVLTDDELGIIGTYLNVTGNTAFSFPQLYNSSTNAAGKKWLSYGVGVSFDVKAASGTPVVSLGDENGNAVSVRINAEAGTIEYYTGSAWTAFATDIEADKWYTLSITTRATGGGGLYNGKFKIYLDGVLMTGDSEINYAAATDYMNRVSVSDVSEETPLGIDNIVVIPVVSVTHADGAQKGAMQRYEKGTLAAAVRNAQSVYNAYENNVGTKEGQCTTASFQTLSSAISQGMLRYNQRQYRTTSETIATDAAALDAAVAGIEIVPYRDYYINSIYYLNETKEQSIYSPQINCYIDGVSVTRYAEEITEETKLIVALYTDNKLSRVQSFDISADALPIGEAAKIEIDGGIKITDENCSVKCFIMDKNTLVPFAHSLKSASLGSEKASIFIASDSIYRDYIYTQNSEYPQTGIGQALVNYFDSDRVEIKNRAISGYSTKTFIANGKLDSIAAEMQEGDYLLVSFGHNDHKEGTNQYTDIASYKSNLNEFIDTAASCGANVVILTPPVRNVDSTASYSVQLKEYSDAAIAVAKERNVPYIDLNTLTEAIKEDAFYMIFDAYDARYANDPMFTESIYYTSGRNDTSHLCKFGAETYAGIIADKLKEMYHPLMDAVVEYTPVRPSAE